MSVSVPQPLPNLCCRSAMAMERAGGESVHMLLSGSMGDAGRQEAAQALLGLVVPFIGWLLLCKSTSHLAHVDPHPGNFRWDAASHTLWVLDWGSSVQLSDERRKALCMLIGLVAGDEEDDIIADVMRSFGVHGASSHDLARLMRGMLNASTAHAAPDAIGTAAMDSILDDVDEDIVPVVRCLGTLGGMLKELQRKVHEEYQQDVDLSLATLWSPLATMGLET